MTALATTNAYLALSARNAHALAALGTLEVLVLARLRCGACGIAQPWTHRSEEVGEHGVLVLSGFEVPGEHAPRGVSDEHQRKNGEEYRAHKYIHNKEQQRKNGRGPYKFLRVTDRQLDTVNNGGWGAPVKPVGLIASVFRPSDDATTLLFLVPSNFMAVTTLKKMADVLTTVNHQPALAKECNDLANEVHNALMKYAIYNHPKYGKIYAYEVDGFGNQLLMDDANVPSLLAMPYLGDVSLDDPIYQNTRRFVWSDDNPYFFKGKAGEGIGGPHIGYDMAWPMSIMMKAFTSTDDKEIKDYIQMLMDTDADTGMIHESFNVNDADNYTRPWFAWSNSIFSELLLEYAESLEEQA